jgi:hypothetical protein
MRLTSRNRDAGSRSVTTCPIPIITYQLTTSTPSGRESLGEATGACKSEAAKNGGVAPRFHGRL